MWRCVFMLGVLIPLTMAPCQTVSDGPRNEKAKKTYEHGLELERRRDVLFALDAFKKADKQDGGHCVACQSKVLQCAMAVSDWNSAESAASMLVSEAKIPNDLAVTHYQFGFLWIREGSSRHKPEYFERAHDELTKSLAAVPNFGRAILADGFALAQVSRDEEAKARWNQYVKSSPAGDPDRERAMRYLSDPQLARARMAPAFVMTTIDGQRISLDSLQGKVVLLDFWATWCAPCRAALPHIQKISHNFQGQPLVVLSVSVDHDEKKWKDFVAANQMTWLQTRDQGFGDIANLFGVHAIPHTFTIDSDGVLQDEQIGDGSIEGKLKKLVAKAQQAQARSTPVSQ